MYLAGPYCIGPITGNEEVYKRVLNRICLHWGRSVIAPLQRYAVQFSDILTENSTSYQEDTQRLTVRSVKKFTYYFFNNLVGGFPRALHGSPLLRIHSSTNGVLKSRYQKMNIFVYILGRIPPLYADGLY